MPRLPGARSATASTRADVRVQADAHVIVCRAGLAAKCEWQGGVGAGRVFAGATECQERVRGREDKQPSALNIFMSTADLSRIRQ